MAAMLFPTKLSYSTFPAPPLYPQPSANGSAVDTLLPRSPDLGARRDLPKVLYHTREHGRQLLHGGELVSVGRGGSSGPGYCEGAGLERGKRLGTPTPEGTVTLPPAAQGHPHGTPRSVW